MAQAPEAGASAQRPQRASKPVLTDLEQKFDVTQWMIEDVLKIEIDDLEGYPDSLKRHARNLKKYGKEFVDASRQLSNKYTSCGSIRQAQETRNLRNEMQKDINESIKAINYLLSKCGLDETSNLDCSSIKSGYSLSSELNLSPQTQEVPPIENLSLQHELYPQPAHKYFDNIGHTVQSDPISTHPGPVYNHTEAYRRAPSPAEISPAPYFENRHYWKSSVLPVDKRSYNPEYKDNLKASTPNTVHAVEENFHDPSEYAPPPPLFADIDNPPPFIQPKKFPPPLTDSKTYQYQPRSYLKDSYNVNAQSYVPNQRVHFSNTQPNIQETKHKQSENFLPTRSYGYRAPTTPHMPVHECTSSVDILTKHIRQQDILKKSIQPFSGSAFDFWPWIGKLDSYVKNLDLSPLEFLQLLESHCTGEAQRMISRRLAAMGEVSSSQVDEIFADLSQRFGSSQQISTELFDKIQEFPVIQGKDIGRNLENLLDLCRVVLYNMERCEELSSLNLSTGLRVIRSKLPEFVQNEWRRHGMAYERDNSQKHPPFSIFVNFLNSICKSYNNKKYETINVKRDSSLKINTNTRVLQTNLKNNDSNVPSSNKIHCHFHNSDSHSLTDCKAFCKLSFQEKKQLAFNNKLCFICLESHLAVNCNSNPKCNECGYKHVTAMHCFKSRTDDIQTNNVKANSNSNDTNRVMFSKYANINSHDKNCSRTLLVEMTMDGVDDKKLIGLAIIDDQSTVTLVDDKLVEYFGKDFPVEEYSLKFASDSYEISNTGKLVSGLKVRGVLESEVVHLPPALSCPDIADTSGEVATPEDVKAIRHLSKYANNFPQPTGDVQVLLLIGRDCGRAMAFECLTKTEPYVHRTPLGYSLVGRLFPQSNHVANNRVLKTNVIFPQLDFKLKFSHRNSIDKFETFDVKPDDDVQGLSQDDHTFLSIMSTGICTTQEGNLQLPLPVKDKIIPDNKEAVYNRTKSTLLKLAKDAPKLDACLDQMSSNINAGFVEEVASTELKSSNSCWYLPIFSVTHPKKMKVRLVYDASARYKGVSLNDLLYQGPDLNNQLRGVLYRFREKPIAFSADIQSMFSNFKVPSSQSDLLRFYWYRNNDPSLGLSMYRSSSHIFGCSSSPAVASYALKHLSQVDVEDELKVAQPYLYSSFYVDDCLCSVDTPEDATKILSATITLLKKYNIRLHKISSNSKDVLQSFPSSEVAESKLKLSFDSTTSHQHVLGVAWDVESDSFMMDVQLPQKSFTKRGILSVVGSVYDPVGIISPVVLTGRLFQRAVLPAMKTKDNSLSKYDWDDELPLEYRGKWDAWLASLRLLCDVKIPRSFYPLSFSPIKQELHIYSDASDNAIGHVMYMRNINAVGDVHVSYVTGASKVAPRCATTIPRLELCAALQAARCTSAVVCELNEKPDDIFLYTDSCIVLGYLSNKEKRFTKYVERRVGDIRKHIPEDRWFYVPTNINPADIASRPHTPSELFKTCWFTGPDCLSDRNYNPSNFSNPVVSTTLPETKQVKTVLHTKQVQYISPFKHLFNKTNSFTKIINIVKYVLKFISLVRKVDRGNRSDDELMTRDRAIKCIIKEAQKESYETVIKLLVNNQELPERHSIAELSPYIDSDQVLRVGGRLKNANIPFCQKHPALIPKDHPLSRVLISYFHIKSKHQGCHISHGTIIQAGYHIENGRHLIKKVIKDCIICKKLRAPNSSQLMADLPQDRLEVCAPFTNIGIDVFGHFYIHDGRNTRSTRASKKIWVVIFVCMSSRAIHLEPLVAMDTNSFRNALIRFVAVRGPCKLIRSDQGTNFTGAKRQLESIYVPDLTKELDELQIKWILNPPYASHHSGSWERKIGSVRRVLEGTMATMSHSDLSRDEFSTIIAEAASLVNNTPLWAVPNHPDDPAPLTPSMLLTLKDHSSSLPIEETTEKDLFNYGKLRYKRIHYLSEQFWQRWQNEYIQSLTRRHKWKVTKPCISISDVVLIRDKNAKRNKWPLGRVHDIKYSSDGLVRSATIKIAPLPQSRTPRYINRCISDLVLLIPSSNHKC